MFRNAVTLISFQCFLSFASFRPHSLVAHALAVGNVQLFGRGERWRGWRFTRSKNDSNADLRFTSAFDGHFAFELVVAIGRGEGRRRRTANFSPPPENSLHFCSKSLLLLSFLARWPQSCACPMGRSMNKRPPSFLRLFLSFISHLLPLSLTRLRLATYKLLGGREGGIAGAEGSGKK